MATNNDLHDLRRSALVYNSGPGSVVDFQDGGGTVSGVIAGLEEWDKSFGPAGLNNEQTVYEPRLQKRLNVNGFRTPPVKKESGRGNIVDKRRLVAVRFPLWLQCSKCNKIKCEYGWGDDFGKAYRYCSKCKGTSDKQYVFPVRFVVACENGHLDEFPWHRWVRHEDNCPNAKPMVNGEEHCLILKSEAYGLSGLILECEKCGSRRSMENVFSPEFSNSFGKCAGRRPWLTGPNEQCEARQVAVQRGASNLYFPIVESALSIPPWSDRLQEMLGSLWRILAEIEDEALLDQQIDLFAHTQLKKVFENELSSMSLSEFKQIVKNRFELLHQDVAIDLKPEEYFQFMEGMKSEGDFDSEVDRHFEIREENVSGSLSSHISKIVRAVRLREVRAIKGFTRINPPDSSNPDNFSKLSKNENLDWLPAIEMQGEGIFISLNEGKLEQWEANDAVKLRVKRCKDDYCNSFGIRSLDDPELSNKLTPRYMLCHTFAHAVMRQLILECGYSAASLQERIYSGLGDVAMSGLLIYTATTDSEGTLGGLSRLGKTDRIEKIIVNSIRKILWCSSDPLCIHDSMGARDSFSQSVCHSCCLAPETSCESYNRFLDRALLVGTDTDRSLGFFDEFSNVKTT